MFQKIEDRTVKAGDPDLRRNHQDILLETVENPDDGLLATAVPIMLVAYGVGLGIVALSLAGSGAALFAILISAGYGAVYFGVPLAMARMRSAYTPLPLAVDARRRPDQVSVFTGLIGRGEAVLQMVIVPLAVAAALAGFSIIWLAVQP